MADRVLMVDDDRELVELVTEYLHREGFETEAVHNGEAGVSRALSGDFSLVVLDVMMPGIGGFEVLRRIRASSSSAARVPILMLTARGEEIDRVMGLEWGADDYLAKPHSPRELLARVRATLRRVQLDHESAHRTSPDGQPREGASPDIPRTALSHSTQHASALLSPALPPSPRAPSLRLQVGDLVLDGAARVVRVDEAPVELTAVEFDLLALLLLHAGEVVSRETISRDVFNRPLAHFDRALDVHISNLRRKLGALKGGEERIKTVRSVGYVYAKV